MREQREVLAARVRQPGHDQSWRASELRFAAAARELLPERFTVTEKPHDLADFYAPHPQALGLEPEAKILDRVTGRHIYVEVKKQGRLGNAEERAYKHHTTVFARALRERTGLDYHAYVTVFCDELATLRRYVAKIPFHIEDGHFLLWSDYDATLLAAFLDGLRDRFLDPQRTCAERCVDRVQLVSPAPRTEDTLF